MAMKVAYWPGCVSRGFTPELHGSMAKVAPMLDIELVELDRACCTGAGVIAEHNQELADTLIWFVIPLAIFAVAAYWLQRRSTTGQTPGKALVAVVSVAAVLLSGATLVDVALIGHSGAKASWAKVAAQPKRGGEGGEGGDGDGN